MTVLADYRSDVGNLLATAVDTATWPTTLIDEALRRALNELNLLLVYEADFTVNTPGHTQDLSSLTDVLAVLAVAYPWQDGSDFGRALATWRRVGPNVVYFSRVAPTTGETLRVRYNKLHAIEDLDSAGTTTVPEGQRALVGLWAAANACLLRQRQISENPALPRDAAQRLQEVAATLRQRAEETVSQLPSGGPLLWAEVGLA